MSEEGDVLESELKEINSGGGGNGQLPNAVATLVLGIVSIVGCLFYGLPGLICGIIGISLHSKDKRLYNSNKSRYESSYKLANAGYICSIIGTSLSALYFIIIIFVFAGLASAGRF